MRVGSRVKVAASALQAAAASLSAASDGSRRIERLLVANRGELVVRIARTCRQLGIRCLALVPEDQSRAWWISAADEIVPHAGSYLDQHRILDAARAARADAIHPGYGFLAENADFADAVEASGMAWVGPPAAAMRSLGDKAAARRLAAEVGVPTIDGYDGDDQADSRLAAEAGRIGYPVLVKPSAGGGGKGMHVLADPSEAADTLARARREAKAAFGDDRLILERYLARPRHIEVQLLADKHGNAVHFGERECSLQRRHQKVVEESPSPAVDAVLRARLGKAALSLAASAGYVGAGTAEFLLDSDGSFFFLEVNARLQVEHPVTELVTSRDLVADQLQIATGAPLSFAQSEVRFDGHAIEARLYAEDPNADFLPATGEIVGVNFARIEGVRIDAGVAAGDVIGTKYDPLLAKFIAVGQDRDQALHRLDESLGQSHVLGLTTNRGFLRWLIAEPDVRSGATHTSLIDERWQPHTELPQEAWRDAAAALAEAWTRQQSAPVGFRLNAAPRLPVRIGEEERSVEFVGPATAVTFAALGDTAVVLDLDGQSVTASVAEAPTVESAARHAAHETGATERVSAPMPGTVLSVRVSAGDSVQVGQVLVVLEAMKMENTVVAPGPAHVERVLVREGQQVQRGESLVELA